METWTAYGESLRLGLDGLAVSRRDGTALTPAEGFSRWCDMTRELHVGGHSLYIIGNGGSAMLASHLAADACKNGGLRAYALNDASLLTATANDVAFEETFALPLSRLGRSGDLVISVSSSGRSPNILRAIEAARSLEMRVVTLSGKDPDNPSRSLGDLNFYVPSARYGWVESAHLVVLHYWLDQYLNLHGRGAV